jgi:hypothetical protein
MVHPCTAEELEDTRRPDTHIHILKNQSWTAENYLVQQHETLEPGQNSQYVE